MMLRVLLYVTVVCSLFSSEVYARQPTRCVQTFRIENGSRPNFVIVPGVVNCFSCAVDAGGIVVSWMVADGEVTRPLQDGMPLSIMIANQSTVIAEVEGNYLILPVPELYVLPGIRGRQDIFCSLPDTGDRYKLEAVLTSPELLPPQFSGATVIVEGGTLSVSCINTVPIAVGTVQMVNPNGTVVNTGIFTVRNITRSFAGTYSCVVSSTLNNSSLTVTAEVIVQYAPEVIASNSSSYEILSGERLHLQCGYVGVPTPSLQWHHNGTVLGNGSNSVRIINDSSFTSIMVDAVKLNSGGTYTCRATNVLGSGSYDYTVMVAVHGSKDTTSGSMSVPGGIVTAIAASCVIAFHPWTFL